MHCTCRIMATKKNYTSFYYFLFTLLGSDAVIYRLNDSEYARMPPLFALDPYHPCLRRGDGPYCLLRLDLYSDHENEIINLIKGYSENSVKHFNYTYLQRGVCVPTTCKEYVGKKSKRELTNEDFHVILGECFNESIYRDYGVGVKLTKIYYCNERNNNESNYDASDWIVAAILLTILAINIVGSYYDAFYLSLRAKNRDDDHYLACFSIFRNWKWLTTYEPSEPRMEKLNGLHCFKCIVTFFIVMAHCTWIHITFSDSSREFEEAYDTWYYQVIHGGMMLVQAFFVLSGFLSTYRLLIMEETTQINWSTYSKIVMLRFWRLTPAYAVVLAVTATWLRHAGDGPLWQLEGSSIAAACRTHAWTHLLYINNYIKDNVFCALHTWYLAADFQLFLLGLAVMTGMQAQSRRLGLSVLLIAGIVLPAWQVWLQDLDGVVIMSPEFPRTHVNPTYHLTHKSGHANIACYAIGMATAFLLYHLQKIKADFSKNNLLWLLCWFVAPAISCLFASCSIFYEDGPRASLPLRMFTAVAHRILMAVLTSFAVLGLAMRWNGSICQIFEWKGWRTFSRLSYCIYLIHLNLVHIFVARRTQLSHMSLYNLAIVTVGVCGASLLLALPLYLLVEAPAARLAKIFTLRQLSRRTIKTT